MIVGVDIPSDNDVRIALATARTFARTERLAKLYAAEALRMAFPDDTLTRIGSLLGLGDDQRRTASDIRHAREAATWSAAGLDLVLTAIAREEVMTAA